MGLEEISNNLLKFQKHYQETVLKVLRIEAQISVDENFELQGRPVPWERKAKDDGRAILTGKTSRLRRTINYEIDFDESRILMGSNLPYSKIQQEGGVINHPGRTLKFRKKKGKTVFAGEKHKRIVKETQGKPYIITLKPRPFLIIPAMDTPRIIASIRRIPIN